MPLGKLREIAQKCTFDFPKSDINLKDTGVARHSVLKLTQQFNDYFYSF